MYFPRRLQASLKASGFPLALTHLELDVPTLLKYAFIFFVLLNKSSSGGPFLKEFEYGGTRIY